MTEKREEERERGSRKGSPLCPLSILVVLHATRGPVSRL